MSSFHAQFGNIRLGNVKDEPADKGAIRLLKRNPDVGFPTARHQELAGATFRRLRVAAIEETHHLRNLL